MNFTVVFFSFGVVLLFVVAGVFFLALSSRSDRRRPTGMANLSSMTEHPSWGDPTSPMMASSFSHTSDME